MNKLSALLRKEILLYPHELNKDINNVILMKLKNKVEGKCIDEGYVVPDTIEIIKKTVGYFSRNMFSGITKIMVYYTAEIINPQNGDLIKCNIQFINKIGIQATNGPLLILISKEFQTDKSIFNDKKLGDEIEVMVLGKKFSINDECIEIAAKFDENEVIYNEIQLEKDLKNINIKSIPISSINTNNIDLSDINDSDEDDSEENDSNVKDSESYDTTSDETTDDENEDEDEDNDESNVKVINISNNIDDNINKLDSNINKLNSEISNIENENESKLKDDVNEDNENDENEDEDNDENEDEDNEDEDNEDEDDEDEDELEDSSDDDETDSSGEESNNESYNLDDELTEDED